MSSFNFMLLIVFPVFLVIIFLLYFFIIRDVNKEIIEYEKKTGKKIKVEPLSVSENTNNALLRAEKIINFPLNFSADMTQKKYERKQNKLERKLEKKRLRVVNKKDRT